MFDSRLPLPETAVNKELERLMLALKYIKVSVEDGMLLYSVNCKDIYDLVGEVNQLIGALELTHIVAIPHKSFFWNDGFEVRARKELEI